MKETKIASFGNQKGGVGKSTMTSLLANYIHNNTDYSVCVVDADDLQQTLMKFREHDKERSDYNEDLTYDLVSISSSDFPEAIKALYGEYDFIFVDLPGNLKQEGVINSYMLFDFVFVPTGLSKADLESTLQFLEIYESVVAPLRRTECLDVNVNVFFNRVNPKVKEFKEFMKQKASFSFNLLSSYVKDNIEYQRNSSTFENYSQVSNSGVDQSKEFCEEILTIIKNKVNATN